MADSKFVDTLKAFAVNPVVFGIGIGIANGLIATIRNKPVSIQANIATALVVGAGEAALLDDKSLMLSYGIQSALGASLGLAVFTRWDPYNRAIIEKYEVPAPPLPPEIQERIAGFA